MGTYKASRNNNDEIMEEEKSEKEQKKESTAKALDVGVETGLDIYTAGAFSKVKNTVTSVPIVGKLAQKKWDKTINKAAGVVSNTPLGDLAKKADDVGITDAARGLKDTYNMANGQMPNKNSNSNISTGRSNLFNNLSKFKSKSSSRGSLFSGGSFKVNNLFSFKMKLIIIGCFIGFFLFICIFMTVFAEPDDVNMGLTNSTELSSKGSMVTKEEISNKLVYLDNVDISNIELNKDSIYVISMNDLSTVDDNINTIKNIMSEYNYYVKPTGNSDIDTKLKNEFQDKVLENGDNPLEEIYQRAVIDGANINSSDMEKKLEELAMYYINNVKTYSQGKSYAIPFINNEAFRGDCTGFAVAYMSYVSGSALPRSYSGEMVKKDGSWANKVSSYGWKAYSTDEIGELRLGDVLVADSFISYSKGNHAEIYVDETHTFGWGSVKKAYPVNNALKKSQVQGHTVYSDSHRYVTVYRYGNINN